LELKLYAVEKAGGRRLKSGPGCPDILARIDGLVVLPYFVMDVWTRRTPGAARVAYLIASPDPLPSFNGDL
jgi:hypothetical protein